LKNCLKIFNNRQGGKMAEKRIVPMAHEMTLLNLESMVIRIQACISGKDFIGLGRLLIQFDNIVSLFRDMLACEVSDEFISAEVAEAIDQKIDGLKARCTCDLTRMLQSRLTVISELLSIKIKS